MSEGETQDKLESIIQDLLRCQVPGDGTRASVSTVGEMYRDVRSRFYFPLRECKRRFIDRSGGDLADLEYSDLENGLLTYAFPDDETRPRLRHWGSNGPIPVNMNNYNYTSTGFKCRFKTELRRPRRVRDTAPTDQLPRDENTENTSPRNEYLSGLFNNSQGLELLLLLNKLCFPRGYLGLRDTILVPNQSGSPETGRYSRDTFDSVNSSLVHVLQVLRIMTLVRAGDNNMSRPLDLLVEVAADSEQGRELKNTTSLTELRPASAVHHAALALGEIFTRTGEASVQRREYHDEQGNVRYWCTYDNQDLTAVIEDMCSDNYSKSLHRALDQRRTDALRMGCKHIAVSDGLTFIATHLEDRHSWTESFDHHHELDLTQSDSTMKLLQYLVNTTLEDPRMLKCMEIMYIAADEFYKTREMTYDNARELRRVLRANFLDYKFHSDVYSVGLLYRWWEL